MSRFFGNEKSDMARQHYSVDMIGNGNVHSDDGQINGNNNNVARSSLQLQQQNEGDDGDAPEETDMDPIEEKKSSELNFAAKKTVAQGMMDVALITANANQLKYLIQYQRKSSVFWIILFLIIISLLLQVAVGVSLIFKGRFDVKGKAKSKKAEIINNYVVVGVFIITIVNVFIAAFNIDDSAGPSIRPNL